MYSEHINQCCFTALKVCYYALRGEPNVHWQWSVYCEMCIALFGVVSELINTFERLVFYGLCGGAQLVTCRAANFGVLSLIAAPGQVAKGLPMLDACCNHPSARLL